MSVVKIYIGFLNVKVGPYLSKIGSFCINSGPFGNFFEIIHKHLPQEITKYMHQNCAREIMCSDLYFNFRCS